MAPLERRPVRVPAGNPALARGFTVALVDMFLDEPPSEETGRAFAAAVVRGARRYEAMTS